MPRIRSIKPEFWSDYKISQLDFFTRLFYIALWNFADDHGRGRALAKELSGFAFPNDDNIDKKDIEKCLSSLQSHGMITLYSVSGMRCFEINAWLKHQAVNRPTASKIPAHGDLTEDYMSDSLMPQDKKYIGIRNQEVGSRSLEVGIRNQESGEQELILAPTCRKKPLQSDASKQANSDTWNAYAEEFERTRGSVPLRTAQVNAQIAQLVKNVPMGDAPQFVVWFLSHGNAWYIQKGHSIGVLLADCQKLYAEWKGRYMIHSKDVRDLDKKSSNNSMVKRIQADIDAGRPLI